jgi:gluconolactonase
MVGGRWSRERVPLSVQLLQRQLVRLPGSTALLRTSHPKGCALRARRHSVCADNFNSKKLNSPNDVVAHPDGSYWFTDPPLWRPTLRGHPDAPGGATNAGGKLNPRIGQPAGFVPGKRELPTNCYRIDPSGRVDLVVTEDQVPDPNGLAFSPDFKKLYVVSTGKGPGDTGPGGKGDVFVFDVGADNKLTNQKRFSDFIIDGVKCGPDGVRCDVNGLKQCRASCGL